AAFFFSSRRRHARFSRDWSSDVCSSDLSSVLFVVIARAMDRIFLLHADHEQNASTSTVRLAGSTGANPFACIASGIAALWGPAQIGRASCRERGLSWGGGAAWRADCTRV